MKQPKIPVKMLTTLTILMVFLCVGSYLLSPKWQAVRAEYQRQRDPLHQFASQQTPEAQLQALLMSDAHKRLIRPTKSRQIRLLRCSCRPDKISPASHQAYRRVISPAIFHY